MKIAVIGTGYVGTVTGTCLAELGHDVTCADADGKRIQLLAKGVLPFFEEGLESLLKTNLEEGRLHFVNSSADAVKDAEVVFLCVGTPPLPSGKPDMAPLKSALVDIATALTDYTLIVERSTLPIRTGEWLEQQLRASVKPGIEFDIAAVPQFLREGQAVRDFMHSDRIVIGANTQRAIDILVNLHQPLNAPLHITDINSAELIKHATNAFLAMKISFINSIAQICERTGADVVKVAKGVGLDHRIQPDYLNAGVGYGGIFFPKDIASLVAIADECNINLDLIKSVDTVNRYQRLLLVDKVERALGGNVHGKTIALWGLAYRPHTDDMRDAPSLTIIRSLQKRGAKIVAYDPLAIDATRRIIPELTYVDDPYEAAKKADAIVILTNWRQIETISLRHLKETTDCRIIVDGRNLFNPTRMAESGFNYISIGRQSVKASTTSPGDKPKKTAVKA